MTEQQTMKTIAEALEEVARRDWKEADTSTDAGRIEAWAISSAGVFVRANKKLAEYVTGRMEYGAETAVRYAMDVQKAEEEAMLWFVALDRSLAAAVHRAVGALKFESVSTDGLSNEQDRMKRSVARSWLRDARAMIAKDEDASKVLAEAWI